jgi:DNA-binding NarL/FixJ family response regulator
MLDHDTRRVYRLFDLTKRLRPIPDKAYCVAAGRDGHLGAKSLRKASGMPGVAICVFIADKSPIVLAGLRTLFSECADVQVVGEAVDSWETVEKVTHLNPDLVLMELDLPGDNGLNVIRALRNRAERSKILLLTSDRNRGEFVEAMKLGCSGILFKDASLSLIKRSVHKVHEGEIWLDAETVAAVIRQFGLTDETIVPRSKGFRLTQRERELTALVVHGYKNKEIGQKMFTTERTVKNQLHSVFKKLGICDRLELALYALHRGIGIDAAPISGLNRPHYDP